MKIDLSQFRQIFLIESEDHVASMEAGLLALRSAPDDIELLNGIFRSAHSIKGGAGSFGMTSLVRFTHSLESLLDRLRTSEMQATDLVIDILLRSVDQLRYLLSAGADAEMPLDALELNEQIDGLTPSDSALAEVAPEETRLAVLDEREIRLYTVEFRPDRNLFSSGTNPIVLLRNLAALGTVSCCHLHTEDLPLLADLDPAQCYLSWTVELASLCAEAELREVFEFVDHLAEINIQCVDPSRHPDSAPATVTGTPGTLAARPASNRSPVAAQTKSIAKKTDSNGESGSIRVAISKVDRLIDLVGELVIAHVMTAQMVESFEPSCLPKLREAVAAMERNTRELHERVMGIRMLPVGTLFQRYTRTVYDIAQVTGKQMRLEMSGEETEIDKSMLELLGDPLTHLVHNAADHGIEAAEVRQAAG